MKFVPNGVTTRVASSALRVQYHSPTLLLVGGVIGVGATVVLACKATLQVDEVLKQAEKDRQQLESIQHLDGKVYTEEDRKHDLRAFNLKSGLKVVKLYAPAAAVGVLSIAALTSSNRILTQRNVALTAAYATIEKAFNEYRERVRETFGEKGDEVDRKFMHGTREVEVTDEAGKKKTLQVVGDPSGYAMMFDRFNPNWQPNAELNLYWLKCHQNWLNNKLTANGHLFLNDVYEDLGFEKTDAGQVVGWWIGRDSEGDGFVDFGVFDANNEQVRDFVSGADQGVLLDFNVDGVVFRKLGGKS